MPFFDFDPIDPDLDIAGNLGPGRENRLEDRVKLASAIEKKTGAAPYAELGRFGKTLGQRLARQSGGREDSALSPGFLGAIGAAQIRRGTDPDATVLKDGPTRDALRGTGGQENGKPFAPLPALDRPVGPRRLNRPQDRRALQGKLASLGYVPRVTEKPLFPNGAAGQGGGNAADGLSTLLDGVRRFQRTEGLKPDGLTNPGGPTERALDVRNERARTARLERLETVSRDAMESDAPEYAAIADRPAADALAGLLVANEVQDQRKARLDEQTGHDGIGSDRRKTDRKRTTPNGAKESGDTVQETDEEERNEIAKRIPIDLFISPENSAQNSKNEENYFKLIRQEDYWKNRTTYLGVLAQIGGERDVAGFVNKTISAERREANEQLKRTPDETDARIVLTGGRRPRRPPLPSIGSQITQRGIDLRAERLLEQIRKYDPGFWRHQFRNPGLSSRFTRDNIRFFEEELLRYRSRAAEKKRKQPGRGWTSGKLPTVGPGQGWLKGTHRNAGFIPEHIAAKLRDRRFRNFDHFRSEFWKTVEDDPIARRGFSASDLQQMRKGNAPQAHESQHVGGQQTYQIHHSTPLSRGGPTYDMRNMTILTPRVHQEILAREYHYGIGR